MTAHVAGSLLSDFLDGELAPSQRATVEAHLGSCQACRRELEGLRHVSRLVRSLPQKPLPTGFMQKLQRRRAAPRGEPQHAVPWPGPARLAAFALSSVVVGLIAYDRLRPAPFPNAPLPSAALSLADVEHARDIKPGRTLARAKGQPLDGAPKLGLLAGSGAAGAEGPSNEQLQATIEQEKKRMGIRSVAAKRGGFEKAVDSLNADVERLTANLAPTRIDGAAPESLKKPEELAAAAQALAQTKAKSSDDGAPGSPVTSAAGAAAANAAPAPAPAGPETFVLVTEAERQAMWSRLGLRMTPPAVNYKRNVLALVVAPDLATALEIIAVQTRADRVSVQYRLFPRAEAVAGANAVPVRAYQFRTVPKGAKPIVFELVE